MTVDKVNHVLYVTVIMNLISYFNNSLVILTLIASIVYSSGTADNTAPVITPVDDITRKIPIGTGGTTVTWKEPSATDNSGTATLTSRTNAPGSFFSVGTTLVTYIFADPSGNNATLTFNVNVVEVSLTLPSTRFTTTSRKNEFTTNPAQSTSEFDIIGTSRSSTVAASASVDVVLFLVLIVVLLLYL